MLIPDGDLCCEFSTGEINGKYSQYQEICPRVNKRVIH